MNKYGYVHADIHPGNIGIVKTRRNTIRVFGRNIRTYGNQVQILDNDTVMHKDYKLDNKSREFYEKGIERELLWMMMNLSYSGDIEEDMELLKNFRGSEDNRRLREYSDNEKERFELYRLIRGKNIKFYMPIEDILFIVKNKKNLGKIIDYIMKKIDYK